MIFVHHCARFAKSNIARKWSGSTSPKTSYVRFIGQTCTPQLQPHRFRLNGSRARMYSLTRGFWVSLRHVIAQQCRQRTTFDSLVLDPNAYSNHPQCPDRMARRPPRNHRVYMAKYGENLSILSVWRGNPGVPCKSRMSKAGLYACARQSPIGRILSDAENALNPSSCDVTLRWVIGDRGGDSGVDSSRNRVVVCMVLYLSIHVVSDETKIRRTGGSGVWRCSCCLLFQSNELIYAGPTSFDGGFTRTYFHIHRGYILRSVDLHAFVLEFWYGYLPCTGLGSDAKPDIYFFQIVVIKLSPITSTNTAQILANSPRSPSIRKPTLFCGVGERTQKSDAFKTMRPAVNINKWTFVLATTHHSTARRQFDYKILHLHFRTALVNASLKWCVWWNIEYRLMEPNKSDWHQLRGERERYCVENTHRGLHEWMNETRRRTIDRLQSSRTVFPDGGSLPVYL